MVGVTEAERLKAVCRAFLSEPDELHWFYERELREKSGLRRRQLYAVLRDMYDRDWITANLPRGLPSPDRGQPSVSITEFGRRKMAQRLAA